MKAADGLFLTAWDGKTGKLFLQINKFDQDFLLVVSLPYGLGSNDIGLDRGRPGEERIVHFTRVGPRVFAGRAQSAIPLVLRGSHGKTGRQAVFCRVKLWPVSRLKRKRTVQCSSTRPIFFCQILGAGEQLVDTKQGAYKLDKERNAFALENTKNFPLNTEFESILTFTTEHPVGTLAGGDRNSGCACGHAARTHTHSFNCPMMATSPALSIRAPASSIPATATILLHSVRPALDVRLIQRHRLIKRSQRSRERGGKAPHLLC